MPLIINIGNGDRQICQIIGTVSIPARNVQLRPDIGSLCDRAWRIVNGFGSLTFKNLGVAIDRRGLVNGFNLDRHVKRADIAAAATVIHRNLEIITVIVTNNNIRPVMLIGQLAIDHILKRKGTTNQQVMTAQL